MMPYGKGSGSMLELEADEYATLLDNLHTAATTYLDAFEIARRFYGAMGLEPIGAKARRKLTTKQD
ncbi:MAG: hypothetical protein KatS3mg030_507 [Saprospiraceae bacterium]|nr:MAG: hypothetical protein KatS3mg030_507 [Saprospiraceae bacterium]